MFIKASPKVLLGILISMLNVSNFTVFFLFNYSIKNKIQTLTFDLRPLFFKEVGLFDTVSPLVDVVPDVAASPAAYELTFRVKEPASYRTQVKVQFQMPSGAPEICAGLDKGVSFLTLRAYILLRKTEGFFLQIFIFQGSPNSWL